MLLSMEIKRPFSEADWLKTPEPVRLYVEQLEQTFFALVAKVEQLEKRIEQLEAGNKKNSQNSSKSPSSDSPYTKPQRKKPPEKTEKEGLKKGTKVIGRKFCHRRSKNRFFLKAAPVATIKLHLKKWKRIIPTSRLNCRKLRWMPSITCYADVRSVEKRLRPKCLQGVKPVMALA
jgi:hypothetical protein